MATRPTNDLLVWANTDVNLPNLAGPNKTQPSADLVAKGWDFKQKPSADEFNYILNNLGEWIEYLKTVVIEATPEATANTLALRDTDGSFKVKHLTSTASNGTAPLVVSSTTKVNNLNADLLDGFSTSQTATANTVVVRDSSAKVVSDLTGNAATATKWQTARTLTATGFATGTATNIDGSDNISLALSVGSGFTNSKTQNGYTYLPNGLILQWGYVATSAVTVTLPVTFPNSFLNVLASNSDTQGNSVDNAYAYPVNTSSFYIATKSSSLSNTVTGFACYWLAVGY